MARRDSLRRRALAQLRSREPDAAVRGMIATLERMTDLQYDAHADRLNRSVRNVVRLTPPRTTPEWQDRVRDRE